MMYIYLDNGNDSKLPAMTDPENSTNINDKNYSKIYEKYSKLFMILVVVFFATSVTTTVIIFILTCKLCGQKKENSKLWMKHSLI